MMNSIDSNASKILPHDDNKHTFDLGNRRTMRELVTVQAGGEANWVGAYFWALQEEEQRSDEAEAAEDTRGSTASSAAASTVLYEQASAVSSRVFGVEPRVLLFDEPEAFNPFQAAATAEAEGEEGSSRAAALTWRGGVDVHVLQGQGQRHMMQETVVASPRVWAEAWHGLRSWPQLGRHCVGHTPDAGGWSEAQGGDQLRRLLEGCDTPQGAHVVMELCGPWLGYGLGAAEEWGEEVGGGGLACMALHHAASVRSASTAAKEQESWRLVEAALGVHRLLETGALLLPLGVIGHGHHHHDEREQRRARQAVGLAAASAIYARGEEAGRCHMREWVHGVRSGCSSGVVSLELGFPFPRPPHSLAAAPPVSLHQLLQPSDPRTALSPTSAPSGLLSHLVPLTPGHPSPSSTPVRRVSGLVSLIGGGGGGANDGLWALNDAAKFYPWFQPELNYAEPHPFPVRRWPFPVAWCVGFVLDLFGLGRRWAGRKSAI